MAGDVVLNGTRRLALTTSCLNELNYLFRQLLDGQENESFDVPAGYGGNSDFMHDVLFLHDFMQKTGSLKVHPDTGEVQPAHTSCLHNIKILNLSFNFLEHVNIFHERARESLTVLYLRNNCIESTRGLEGLRQLKELDLAYNCLADGDSLVAFKQLPNLEMPKALRLQLARKSNVPAPEPVVSVPTLQPILPSELVVPQRQATEQHSLPAVSVQGASPSKTVEAPPPGPADQEGSSCSSLETSDSLTPQRPGRRPRRRRSTRVAAILDQEHRSPVEAPATATVQQEILDYKSELESRKQQLGDEWLVGVSRLRLPDAQSTPCGTPESGTFVGPGFSAWQQEGDAITGVANRPSEGVASSRQGTGAAQGSSKGSAPQRRISELSEGVVVLDDVPPDHFGDPGGTGQPEGFSWTSMATSAFAADEADAEDAISQDNVSEESIETVMPEQQGGLFRPGFRKSASDITVLSNPSQSSIMVISTSSANYTAMDVSQEGEKTLSP
ncbi:hypothetical protein IscW_ISCW015413 [Ixodes scapularis]|uniref:LKB1 serine/threonine kinase interacting protein 1 N-terminal domain-containing protein n=1 Tax=Ixodes scapularis TaxID=6945 RepID=B7QNA8_IXOSC|nr:hypothetical protein IscW_ISCW015413 [Ixodes scapularis]|eukprot:XP_002416413.1 hypothetical protein IscW_ISCW015413 [Ixodes scapularis]